MLNTTAGKIGNFTALVGGAALTSASSNRIRSRPERQHRGAWRQSCCVPWLAPAARTLVQPRPKPREASKRGRIGVAEALPSEGKARSSYDVTGIHLFQSVLLRAH